MASSQKGMALVSVVLILTALLSLAHVLLEKVWQSTRQRAEAARREQLEWVARAGIESARRQLAVGYAASNGWQTLLLAGQSGFYPATAAWVNVVNGLSVEIYLRDNADGDGDPLSDNDLKVFVLARARGQNGAEVLVECLCGYETAGSESAAGPAGPGANLSDQPIANYGITD